MLNRRKAVIGWLVYSAAKPVVKRALKAKAKGAVPRNRKSGRRPSTAAIVMAVGATAAALLFWRSRSSDDVEELLES